MHKGDKWIYFLNYHDGMYYPISEAVSRYPLPNDELLRFANEVTEIMKSLNDWIRSNERVDEWEFSEEWRYARDRETGYLYRYHETQDEEIDRFFTLLRNNFSSIDASLLGAINKYDFNYIIYSEIIDYFQIKPYNWINPGREFDASVIEIFENNS
ncbi:MAG: hypothetical protein LBC71_04480 [Oscillospiraceae bacterium]|nr:hypothetical protein [Oscillospiraceae bacterium]